MVASMMFDSDRLVLLWPLPPEQRTSEGIGIGSTVYHAWLAYPDAEALRPEPAAASDALLVHRIDRGYLIRHDGTVVRQLIAGTEELLRAAYQTR
ncbi:hypothetical protein [Actinocatenispora thailandica]|nr:hypothetical protein [Actinocatenispora thailandica]